MLITLASKFNEYFTKTEKSFEVFFTKRQWLFYFLFTLIIIGFNWVLLSGFEKTTTGDFDYFAQSYEAIRKTLLDYHQFPWMNAWVGGGVPLYANPQIGVFSIQTILVVAFGTLSGLKISLLIYSLIGFWSFYILVRSMAQTRMLISICLAAIWIMNGFFMSHYIGHYSFALFQIFPLLCYLVLTITKPRHWVYLSLTISAMALSSLHYAVIQSLLALLLVAVFDLVGQKTNRKLKLRLYVKTILLFLLVCGHRIFYTLDYALDFPRSFADPSNSVPVLLKTFILPPNPSKGPYDIFVAPPLPDILAPYSWGEFNAFVGICVILSFLLTIVGLGYIKQKDRRRSSLYILAVVVFFFIIAIGDFAKWSPHALIHLLPGFSGMRIASRWLIWVIFFGLTFIAFSLRYIKPKTLTNTITLLVFLGVIELALINTPSASVFNIAVTRSNHRNERFEQFDNYDHYNQPKSNTDYRPRATLDRRYETYGFEATLNNYGETRGYEPLIDTRFTPTLRCGLVMNCPMVLSNNAKIIRWSPNKIILTRTSQGPIELNMNPSNYWLINGKRIFKSTRVAEVTQNFIITDNEETITINAVPQSIPEAMYSKSNNIFSKIKRIIKNNFL